MARPVPPIPVRRITDPRELRALAHPTRMALLELLFAESPLTASQCGERLGESAASCSYHLATWPDTATCFPAPGGHGRERPWRPRTEAIGWDTEGSDTSPAVRAAARVLDDVVDGHRFQAWRDYRSRAAGEPEEWREAALSTDVAGWMTAEELETVTQQLYDALKPYVDRSADDESRPKGSRPVRFFAYAYPVATPSPADP